MHKEKTFAVCVAMALAAALQARAEQGSQTGPFGFEPIVESADAAAWDPAAPWKLPQGFAQYVVSDEAALNIYGGGRDDWPDMNTANETGEKAGRYLYRTHEVRGEPAGGAVSVIDLETGATSVIAQDPSWTALDGLRWTPWGTLLFAEETTGGRLFELVLDAANPTAGTAYDRPALGRLAHEGIEVGPDGSVYVIDEFRGQRDGYGGGVYKFVPDRRADLSSGRLYALRVTGGPDGTGQGAWVGPIDPSTAREAGTAAGGTGYNRPEDIEIIGHTLYVAVTEGTYAGGRQVFDGHVLAIDLASLRVTSFVKPGVNVPVEIGVPGDAVFQTGFDNPDNLAATPDGRLMIVEDNVPSDIWVAGKDLDRDGAADRVWLFGSLSDPGAEGTGIYFGKDPNVLFVNVQHSAAPDGDATWAIVKE
jgi:hypothetical protein